MPALPPPAPATQVTLGTQEAQEAPPPPPKKTRASHHHKSTIPTTVVTDGPESTPEAAPPAPAPATAPATIGQEPSQSTPIGQLSTAPNTQDVPSKQNIQQEIATTENGLNGIRRSLSSDEQQTATEIRTFISKAKNALQAGDLDGAHTLTVKARVLLAELNK